MRFLDYDIQDLYRKLIAMKPDDMSDADVELMQVLASHPAVQRKLARTSHEEWEMKNGRSVDVE